jgi:hypothetical protein
MIFDVVAFLVYQIVEISFVHFMKSCISADVVIRLFHYIFLVQVFRVLP